MAVQPRAMQVLITLFQADGAVVARDELVAACWGGRAGGRAVSGGAVNRIIHLLRALALDQGAGSAYLALAAIQPICGHFAAIRRHAMNALSASPNDPLVLAYLCGHYDVIGRQSMGLRHLTQAYSIDPRLVGWYYGYILEVLGRMGEANAAFDRELGRPLPTVGATANALRSAMEREDWVRYDHIAARVRTEIRQHPTITMVVSFADRVRTRKDEQSDLLLNDLRHDIAETGRTALAPIILLCRMGRADQAFEAVEAGSFDHLFTPQGALPPGEFGINALFTPMARPMRRHRGFVRLCARLGLCDFWIATDEWPDCVEEVAPFYDFEAEARRLA